MRARSAAVDVSANTTGAVPVIAFASTRSRHEIQRESEQDRWRVGLVAVLAITLVVHAAAVALDTRVAATVDTRVRGSGLPKTHIGPRAALTP
jgi:hypothetical protein